MSGPGLLAAVLFTPLAAMADPVSWIDWNGKAGSLVQNGATIEVTYTGGANISHADYFSGFPGTYVSDEVSNGPGGNGFLQLVGGSSMLQHHIHFSSAVVNPYIALLSVGAGGEAATFTFHDVASIELLSKGSNAWGNGELAVAGNVVSGKEGNGLIRLNGTFTDLYFTTPVYENWYGAAIGAAAVSAVPEPGTWGMLAAGSLVLALARRRQNARFTRPA
ncbi:PEP-CTERM sorting domain-containing protein [Massilia sp. METH4]|uniref:PEP-CTERM sorting domain-containing protein n=1 Tax=Massilia sp. METH4 TaxID=3123041 RepID=UPI0030CB24C0